MVEHTEALEEELEAAKNNAEEGERAQERAKKLEEEMAVIQGKLNDRVMERSVLLKDMEREREEKREASERASKAAEEILLLKRENQEISDRLSRSKEIHEAATRELNAARARIRELEAEASSGRGGRIAEEAVEAYKASEAFKREVGLLYRDGVHKLMGLFAKEMGLRAPGVDPRSFLALKAFFIAEDREKRESDQAAIPEGGGESGGEPAAPMDADAGEQEEGGDEGAPVDADVDATEGAEPEGRGGDAPISPHE